MKNRRIVIVSFLLVAVLVMGVAYAALTDNLFIKGEANLKTDVAQTEFNTDVYFVEQSGDGTLKTRLVQTTGTSAVPEGETEGVQIGQTDPDSATFHIFSLGKANDYAVFSFVIANDSEEYDAVISLDATYPTTTNSTLFSIEYSVDNVSWVDAEDTAPTTTCEAGGYTVVYVKVTLLGTPDTNTSVAFNVNLTATSTPTT